MEKFVSPIAVDLGGKNTGLFLAHYAPGEVPENRIAATLVMPEESGKMTWSQSGRTATRHRIRSNKRRKLAKRLLRQVITAQAGRAPNNEEWQALSGLLNRRGYNRIEAELDMAPLSLVDSKWFEENFPAHFDDTFLPEQFDRICQDLDRLRRLQQDERFNLGRKEFGRQFLAGIDQQEKKALSDASSRMKEAAQDIISQLDFGHQHRRDYLRDVWDELNKESRLSDLRKEIKLETLYRLVGNISNFQLRTLRWYFNKPAMYAERRLDDQRLHSILKRWLTGWHPGPEEKENRKQALEVIDSTDSALAAMALIEPEWTIPPYEDQNNRRPPKDQTLWLSPASLNSHFPKWDIWANNLRRSNPGWDAEISQILELYDRKSRLGGNAASTKQLHCSYLLQRLLDRSIAHDPYALRLLCHNPKSHKAAAFRQRLESHLGEQHTPEFLKLCGQYYSETNLARQGLWNPNDSTNLLERADINPPHKKRILNLLVGNVLGIKLNEDDYHAFLTKAWRKRVVGNSKLKGLAEATEKCRKEYGNLFNERLRRLRYRIEHLEEKSNKLKDDDKKIWSAFTKSQQAAKAIADYFDHTAQQQSHYANPYSIAQLYTLIESDPKGFSRTTLAAHIENAWRMSMKNHSDGKQAARCSRLTADSIRPFDGVLRRTLERQANEIATLKARQIMVSGCREAELLIPILAEENRFAFSAGLADLKKNGKKRKDALAALKKQGTPWVDKDNRIRDAGKGYCPYTGEQLGTVGEIDHILPRSGSTSSAGTVYNSEANLIWCSRKGNQAKGSSIYTLADLAPRYLKKLYGTDDRSQITRTIGKSLNSIDDHKTWDLLNNEQQRDLRHALFLAPEDPLRNIAVQRLASQQKSRVNGSQAYLIKRIIEQLKVQLGDWSKNNHITVRFSAARIDAREASALRHRLGESRPELAKPEEQQSAASHAIDAICVLASAAAVPKLADDLALGEGLSEDMEWLADLLPQQIEVHWVEHQPLYRKDKLGSRALFKEGIYAEHFLALWLDSKGLRVGFEPSRNNLTVTGKNPLSLAHLLHDFFEQKIDLEQAANQDKPQKLTINKNHAFSFLKKVASQHHTDEEAKQAELLEALRYSTAKKNIRAALFDESKKQFATLNTVCKDKLFTINTKFFNDKQARFEGNLLLPAHVDWKRLCKHPSVTGKLGKKLDKGEIFDWHTLTESFFRPKGNGRPHGKTRREFSLPIIDNPSGGFRIKRKDASGMAIWQLHAIDDTPSRGFAVKAGKIDWTEGVAIDGLSSSDNLTPLNVRYQSPPEKVVAFDHWLPIQIEEGGITLLEMAPGTKDRRYIRVTQPFDIFTQWLQSSGYEIPNHPFGLFSEIRLKDKSKFQKAHEISLLGKPRSNLFITRMGEQVTYWYRVESSNSAMKAAYQKSWSQSES